MVHTYANAGVNIDKKNEAVEHLIRSLTYKREKNPSLALKGHYAGVFDLGSFYGALHTDGVGSKILLAKQLNKWEGIGIDCVAMNVNDLIVLGMEPVSMVDYIMLNHVDDKTPNILKKIGDSLNEGAKIANIEIVGGETAVVPDIANDIDLSGSVFGISKDKNIIDGSAISENDIIIGLSSSGVHSNGYSLIRKIIEDNNIGLDEKLDGNTIGDILVEPTNIYVKEILPITEKVHAMAHITGGGLRNLLRLSSTYKFVLDDLMKPQKIFKFIQKEGDIENKEMYQTFNMGMGFVIIAPEEFRNDIFESISQFNLKVIGHVEKGQGVYVNKLDLNYTKY